MSYGCRGKCNVARIARRIIGMRAETGDLANCVINELSTEAIRQKLMVLPNPPPSQRWHSRPMVNPTRPAKRQTGSL